VGGYFGGLLARAGAPVVMIGRQSFVDAVNAHGLLLDTLQLQDRVRVEASADINVARRADLVLFCVKTTDNAETARAIAPVLAPDAVVISLQNGVDNAEQIRAAAGLEVISAVVYVAASVPQPGHVKHVGRGDLVIGPECENTKRLAEIFARASIPCRISDNIEGELWTKLIWNCALNAISALGDVRYGRIAESEEGRKLVQAVVDEVLAVARAAGVVMPAVKNSDDGMAGAMKIATQMPDAFSSTAQDIHRGKRTEVDSLNGYVARRGAELGVPTPANFALYAMVKLLENSVGRPAVTG